MKITKWPLVGALLIIGIGFAVVTNLWTSKAAGTEGVIGYVDVSEVYYQIFWKLEEVQKVIGPVNKIQDEFNTKTKGLGEEEKKKILAEYQPKFDAELKKAQEQLGPIDNDFQAKFTQLLEKVISEVAKKEGVSIILDRKSVLYGGKDVSAAVFDAIVKELMPPASSKSNTDKK